MHKVLFAVEKYRDARRSELGYSCHDYGIVGSLSASESGVVSCFYYDEFVMKTPEGDVGKAFVCRVEQSRPSLVVATCIIQNGPSNIQPQVYGYVRDELKVPVVMVWFESAPDVVSWADKYAPHVTLNVFVDTHNYWLQFTRFPGRSVWLPEPRDCSLFNTDGNIPRDIAISFIGSAAGRFDRALNLTYLHSSGVPVVITGGNPGGFSCWDYALMLKRSLVTINFTSAITFEHLTGRTAESTLCGCLLLETESKETVQMFQPLLEYVPFKPCFTYDSEGRLIMQEGDLVPKAVEYGLQDRAASSVIANRGRRRALEWYDGHYFWNRVFDLVGV